MSLLGNIIWLVFGGFMSGIGYILGGLSTCLTIIGIPFGIEAVKLGFATFTPFGKEVVKNSNADTTLALILNIIWIILFGWGIALSHLVWGVIWPSLSLACLLPNSILSSLHWHSGLLVTILYLQSLQKNR